jgi:anti-sigma factor RsiW
VSEHRDDDERVVELTCKRIVDLLGEYVDGELPVDVKSRMDGHIGNCAPCMAFMRQYRFADEGVRRCLLKRVPEEVENRLLSFLKGRCQKK